MAIPQTTEISGNRLERDELEMLQARALRSWRDSDWLAQNNPSAWDALDTQTNDVVLDVGGGVGESQQTPGAIVVGQGMPMAETRTGERRGVDLRWSLGEGVPAATNAVDTIVVPENALRAYSPATQDFIIRDIARALRVGGTLVFREDGSMLRAFRNILDDAGFALDAQSRRKDGDHEYRYTLTQKSQRTDELGNMLGREVVLGETRPPAIRQPHSA